MATSEIKFVEKEIKTIAKVPNSIQLSMSIEEAFSLIQVLSLFGGCPSSTIRGHLNKISESLAEQGIDWSLFVDFIDKENYLKESSVSLINQKTKDFIQKYSIREIS